MMICNQVFVNSFMYELSALVLACLCALLHMSRLGGLAWRQTPPRANGWW
jgi:hypothetical protein